MSRYTLITGASSGIGYELAKFFAKDRFNLILVARRKDKLESLAIELKKQHGIDVHVIVADLGKPDAPEKVFQEVTRLGLDVETLVNNAGCGNYGRFAETSLHEELEILQVNVTALTHLTKLFLTGMLKHKQGRILNVASTAAFQPGPMMAVYYASKSYVLSFSEALHQELKGFGITVSALCPGPTISEFQKRAKIEQVRLVKTGFMMTSEEVAKLGYEGLMKGRRVVVTGWINKFTTWSGRYMPRWVILPIVHWIQQTKNK